VIFLTKKANELKLHKFTSLTEDEIIKLIICVIFDIAEYALPILLMPIIGDILDIAGIGIGIYLFGWLGLISLLEFLPFFDYFPFFILTWVIWYYLKKQSEKEQIERLKDKWK
jgi:hypothetical protein